MKKTYTKPEIMFESFILSTSIAACDKDTGLPSRDICGMQFGDDIIFTSGISQCDSGLPVPDDGHYGFCYHNPEGALMLFAS